MNFKLWLENENELTVYHSATKGEFDKPSVDIGSDFDIMGKGFYFSIDPDYASRYGEPKQYKVKGPFATGEQWMALCKKYKKKKYNIATKLAREELQSQGYCGVLGKSVGVIWDQNAFQ